MKQKNKSRIRNYVTWLLSVRVEPAAGKFYWNISVKCMMKRIAAIVITV